MRSSLVVALVVGSGLFFSSPSALRASSLTYTGNPFTSADYNGSPTTPISGSISATVNLSADLSVGFNDATALVQSYTITDGTNTLNQTDSTGLFQFTLDGSGNITGWYAEVYDSGPSYLGTFGPLPVTFGYDGDYSLNDVSAGFGEGIVAGLSYNSSPGAWTYSAGSAPEPGTFVLFAPLGLAGIALLRRRRA